jgi:hypothetical protein
MVMALLFHQFVIKTHYSLSTRTQRNTVEVINKQIRRKQNSSPTSIWAFLCSQPQSFRK